MTALLDSLAATVTALHVPWRPEWSPIFGLLVLYAVLAAILSLGHMLAANFGAPRFAAVRLASALNACIFAVIAFGLALVAAGLPLGRFL